MMIKLVGICGSRVKHGNMEALLEETMKHAQQLKDVAAEAIFLAGKQINGCNHCNWCLRNQSEEKPCIQEEHENQN